MAGRPTKYSPERATQITDRLRAGTTRRAACLSCSISEDSFARWLASKADFADAVMRAEAEAEVRNTALLEKAANGWDGGSTTRTTKTVYRTKKTKLPDGTVVEEPVALQEVSEATTTERLFDWRAAESWLKRRRPEEWGDRLDLGKLKDDRLIGLLEADARRRSAEKGSNGAHPPVAAGAGNGSAGEPRD